ETPGAMVALLGVALGAARKLCAQAGEVWVANDNCPGQVVASGHRAGVERLLEIARVEGLRTRLLDVDGAFHSRVMTPAAGRPRRPHRAPDDAVPELHHCPARDRRRPAGPAGPPAHLPGALPRRRALGAAAGRGPLRRAGPAAGSGRPGLARDGQRADHPLRKPGAPAAAGHDPDLMSALVTGGSSGIGAACVRELARRGLDVGIGCLSRRGGADEVAAEVATGGRRAVVGVADVRDPDAVEGLVTRVEEELGPVEAVVAAAGLTRDRAALR